jgi:hypothetical protein
MAIQNIAVTDSTATSIYTSTGDSAITTIHIANYTGATVVANVFVVPSGSFAGNDTVIYSNYSITAYNTMVIDTEKFILENGDGVFANCNAANSLTATVSSIGI